MADATASPHAGEDDKNVVASASILGDCVLKLTHSTTYEPPLYLFAELLPQVPQGTPPLPVWDAVADAVDISTSSWRLADASQLLAAAGEASKGQGEGTASTAAPSSSSHPAPPAMVTLMSMIAQSRLQAVGLDARALERGSFSAAEVIKQLATLQSRMGLSGEEGAALMSNHFINLLAWQKLTEINNSGCAAASMTQCDSVESGSNDTEGHGASAQPAVLSRKRSRATEDSVNPEAWLPLPDPWATDADLAHVATLNAGRNESGTFVSAGEHNVQHRVDLLRTLTELYQRPWRTLSSCGQQTDRVVPPGTVNVTSPYADNTKTTGASLDPVADLGWTPTTAPGSSPSDFFGSLRVPQHNPSFFSIVIQPRNTSSVVGNGASASQRIPLTQSVTHFGRAAGIQAAAAVAAAAVVPIEVGLEAFTTNPEVLSRYHFCLMLRPLYGGADASSAGAADHPSSKTKARQGDGEAEGAVMNGVNTGTQATKDADGKVHAKAPDHYSLWLVNYGRNGVRVAGRAWVLGDPLELKASDVLVVGEEVEVRVEQHVTADAARATFSATVDTTPAEPTSTSQVKRERAEDE